MGKEFKAGKLKKLRKAEASPDEADLEMIKDIKENPECKEFISAKELMNELKIEI